MTPTSATGRAERRSGFTLVELLVALVLVGAISATVATVLVRQQRFYRFTADLIQTRSQVRQAASVLPQDLRGISSAGGDILEMRDSSFEFFTAVGTGVVCQANPPGGSDQDVYLAPLDAARGPLTTWLSPPRAGDQVAVYDTTSARFSGRLALRALSGAAVVDSSVAGCALSPLLTPADLLRPRYRLRVNLATVAPAAPRVAEGAPVRILRRVRYSLFRWPGDGQWYLGYREFDPAASAEPQLIAGPLRGYAADTTSGLTFTYYDAAGALLAPTDAPTRVARVDVALRALTQTSGTTAGRPGTADGRYATADQFTLTLRNRW